MLKMAGKKKRMQVLSDNCLGCGACISSCPTKSLSLVPAKRPEIPLKKKDLFETDFERKEKVDTFCDKRHKEKDSPCTKNGVGNNWGLSAFNSVSDFATVRDAMFFYAYWV